MQVTYQIAMATGKDAANRRMQKAGRSQWNDGDCKIACDLVERLLYGRANSGRRIHVEIPR